MKKDNNYWFNQLEKYVAGGSSTGSKRATLQPEEPSVIVKGEGCRVIDANNKEYIDFRNGLGPVTLGYNYKEVTNAIKRQLNKGIVFGHPTPLEAEVAKMLTKIIPCAEKVRFLKTGGEALAACIKLARAYTSKKHIIQIGYNGWINTLGEGAKLNPRDISTGVPLGITEELSQLHHTVKWNDEKTVKQLYETYKGEIAAIIVAADYEEMERGQTFYPFLRDITKKNKSVLVFDEIVTGFRIALGGVSEYFNVVPDLAVYAKGIANGMPLSCFCGKKEIMEFVTKGATISSTYGGETLSLAACKQVIKIYKSEPIIDHLWEMGEKLFGALNRLFEEKNYDIRVKGFPPCAIFVTKDQSLLQEFFRHAYDNGVSLYNVSYVNYSHKEKDIDEVIKILKNCI
ncbi:MAG: aminotransferase class III-fold pyridoxal phosphate-dependent enzyme [Clostridiales bacterium]|nr:aminotransferase class III-fold pyridoxal phosphate-dependent enzyme [Clostridiales bacterium]